MPACRANREYYTSIIIVAPIDRLDFPYLAEMSGLVGELSDVNISKYNSR